MADGEKVRLQKELTLLYYNRYLRDRGVITEREYLRMGHLIRNNPQQPSRTANSADCNLREVEQRILRCNLD